MTCVLIGVISCTGPMAFANCIHYVPDVSETSETWTQQDQRVTAQTQSLSQRMPINSQLLALLDRNSHYHQGVEQMQYGIVIPSVGRHK